jgi:hypothetical protein
MKKEKETELPLAVGLMMSSVENWNEVGESSLLEQIVHFLLFFSLSTRLISSYYM